MAKHTRKNFIRMKKNIILFWANWTREDLHMTLGCLCRPPLMKLCWTTAESEPLAPLSNPGGLPVGAPLLIWRFCRGHQSHSVAPVDAVSSLGKTRGTRMAEEMVMKRRGELICQKSSKYSRLYKSELLG